MMRMRTILATTILCVSFGSIAAQTAKVIALTPEDAKKALELHRAVERALANEADFKEKVRSKYLASNDKDSTLR